MTASPTTGIRVPPFVLEKVNQARYKEQVRLGRRITQGEWQLSDPRITGLHDEMVKTLKDCIERLEAGQPPVGSATDKVLSRAKVLLDRIDEASRIQPQP